MIPLENYLTGGLINFNGNRNKVNNQGRLQITLNSLLRNVSQINNIPLILVDNESTDGSEGVIQNFPFGQKIIFQRVTQGEGWYPTTTNNQINLRRTLSLVRTPYYWHIENDSYFYNSGDFLTKAVQVLEENSDLSIIHLRKWTHYDCKDKPGAPQNHCRIDEIRESKNGNIYVIGRSKEECVWVEVGTGLDNHFIPYGDKNDFLSLQEGQEPGNLRIINGRWQRLIENHYATYANHGFIVRTLDLKNLVDKYEPPTEESLSKIFTQNYKAAKLDEDAFVCFGLNTRINLSEEETVNLFKWAEENNYSSILDFSNLDKVLKK